MALATVADVLAAADPEYGPRLERFAARCRDQDLRVAAAIDDTARPVQVVERRTDGIVISGGKQHVVGARGGARAVGGALGPRRRSRRGSRVRGSRQQRRVCV